MRISIRVGGAIALGYCAALLTACASTTVMLAPSPQAPVCDASATALVLWATQWRPEQKDVMAREAAAASGLADFLASSGCFAHAAPRRVESLAPAAIDSARRAAVDQYGVLVAITVRELGPVVKLLSAGTLVEGGTEVVLQVSSWRPISTDQAREFTVHWRNGGPGVIKGVASLPDDMRAALHAGLQPAPAAR